MFGLFWLGGRIGSGPLALPPAPDDPIRLFEGPGHRPRDGCARAGWPASPSSGRWPASSRCRSSFTSSATSRGDRREPPDRARLAAGAHRPDAARPDRPDVRLSRRSDRGAPASSPWWAWPLNLKPVWCYQGRSPADLGGAVRRGQPGHLVARRPCHRIRVVDGIPAPEHGPRARGHRPRRPVDPVGPDRPGRLRVPLLHGAAVRGDGAGLFHGRAVARSVTAHLGARPDRRRAGDHGTGADVVARPAAARSSASTTSTLARRRARRSSPISC